jgi:glycosyltransferase involved in cell wall biosynthesis
MMTATTAEPSRLRDCTGAASQPLVSVIVIFLNAAEFIQEAIESVFTQGYQHWELLLVDDGSTDASRSIALDYAAQYPAQVRLLEHPARQNRGMSASRNLGIANAKGKYIAFLDADDVWLPGKLAQQVALLEAQRRAAMVVGRAQWWYSWTGNTEDQLRDYIFAPGIPPNTLTEPPALLSRFLRVPETSPCTCSVLVRRSVVEQVGGFEERFPGLYEDQAFFAKVCLAGPVFVSGECSARYRQHPNSHSAAREAEQSTARRAFLRWLAEYMSKQATANGREGRRLLRKLWPCKFPNLDRVYQRLRLGLPGRALRSAQHLKLRCLRLPLIRNLRVLQLRRLQPLRAGRQNGTPIVRYYWERYLEKHRVDIRGTALEIGTTDTIRRFGKTNIDCAEAIDLSAHSPEITVVGDLSRADHVPSNRYDCFVNQFTMHLIHDAEAALYHSIRILKPGGVLLINFSCTDYYFPNGLDMGTGQPLFLYRWFTPLQVENWLCTLDLAEDDYEITMHGNIFSRIAYEMNMPAEELTRRELEFSDPGHPVLICARVVKPKNWQGQKPQYRESWQPDVKPAKWNPATGHYAR